MKQAGKSDGADNLCKLSTLQEAIDALRPFTSKVPSEALNYIRAHWEKAEPVLLAEIGKKLESPAEEEDDALFLYAIHLCAEMRCPAAFPFFVQIARLPNLLLDNVMGDILTETFPQMLARTCNDRITDIKALVEDPTLNDFSRGSAIRALMGLVADGELDLAVLSDYCIELLRDKLDRRASNAWDTVIDTACEIGVPGALPLIKAAYERGLADPNVADFDYRVGEYNCSQNVTRAQIRHHVRPFRSTEVEMHFFVGSWDEDKHDVSDHELLGVLNERKQTILFSKESKPLAGSNDPCPCGSGKKYKKCCLDTRPKADAFPVMSVRGTPVPGKDELASDWMEAGYRYRQKQNRWAAYECWQHCWDELWKVLPASLQDPAEAEKTGAFEGYDFHMNWLQDFEFLLVDLAEHNLKVALYGINYLEQVPLRFPGLESDILQNMQADRARLLAILGESEKAIAILEAMLKQFPEGAKGYVELSDYYGFTAHRFNRRPDFKKARQYLQDAIEHGWDYEDYDVMARLEDLDDMEASMRRPLLI